MDKLDLPLAWLILVLESGTFELKKWLPYTVALIGRTVILSRVA